METNEKLIKDRESCITGLVNKEEILNADTNDTVSEELHCADLNIDTDNSQQSDIVESDNDNLVKESKILFKKPVFIGPKRGKIHVTQDPKQKIIKEKVLGSNKVLEDNEDQNTESRIQHISESVRDIALPYTEPPWSGRPGKQYKLEVLKSGLILETIDLSERSFHVVGRLPSCNISLAHPNISRYHAVFQYRAQSDESSSIGLYVYDLGSTHGTFWNGNRIKPNIYVRLHGGHMIRFGCSQRKFIVQAPLEDQEEESEFSITELKEKRILELQERERMQEELAQNTEEDLRKGKGNEDQGIDWGMGEDADEETDMTENPYATTNDEEFFLSDPKKTLRGWFEREGYDLQYQTEQKGIGQFLCWVELPIEGVVGQSIKAEVIVKGKKKEAVVQCALEACRILDRHGLLRQANHEGRKRKARNWEEEDYYDSDEDNFLDRTGTIEKKREQRMRLAGKLEAKVETYSSLLEKHKRIVQQIAHLENCIQNSKKIKNNEAESTNEDALDAFMSTLSSSAASKGDIIKMKLELQNLKKEESKLIDLVNLAKPADLPPLTVKAGGNGSDSRSKLSKNMQNVTQKKKFQTTINNEDMEKPRSIIHSPIPNSNTDETEEVESEDEELETSHEPNQADKQNSPEQGRLTKNTRNIKLETNMDEQTNNKVFKNIELCRSLNSENNKTGSIGSVKDSKDYNEKKKYSKRIDIKGKKQNEKNVKDKLRLDMYREDYSMWVPPENQTGDGKTNLNDKYGY